MPAPAVRTAPSAVELAARVDRHYDALQSLAVDFVQQYDGMGMHRRESGTLLLAKPGRMRWTYSQPAGKLFVLDGRDAFFYSPGQTEVQRVPAKKLDDLRSPLSFLLGHTRIARELSNLTISPGTPDGTGAVLSQTGPPPQLPSGAAPPIYELSGRPRGMEQRVQLLRITVGADGTLLGIRIEEVDGAITSFSFSREEVNVPAAAAEFVFKAPPGTTVVNGLPPI
ncbi:MAG TPA: outer membrane lipoprotein carrier protein LolA [Acidisarcina sp.]